MFRELDHRAIALRYAPWLACAVVLLWHSLQYNFVTDDAFISFVYSRNFAEHGELVFNLGDRVEGYTNFLWTFILGVLMVFGLPPEIMSRVLGTGFAIATLFVALRAVEYIYQKATAWDYMPAALLALSSGYACWSSGGLETQMFTFFVAFALYAYVRGDEQPRWLMYATGSLALAAMTRPEGLLIIAVLGIHRLGINFIRDRRAKPTRAELTAVGVFFAIWAPWFLWRWWYYGHLFPNTYYVKAGGETVRGFKHSKVTDGGFFYVYQWLKQTYLLYVFPLALAGLFVAKPRGRRFYFGTAAGAVAAAYLIYTIRVGGDFMGLHRFIMPVFFIAAMGLVLGLRLGVATIPREHLRKYAAPGLAAVLVLSFGFSQYRLTKESLRWGNWKSAGGIDTPAFLWVYTNDRAQIGKHMKRCFRKDDYSIVGGAGAQPYFGRMAGIDVFGLVSWDIAHCDPRRNPRAGHTKWGGDDLLIKQPRHGARTCPPRTSKKSSRRRWRDVESGPPDFVFHCYAIHGSSRAPALRRCNHWTQRGYKKVTMHIPGMKQQGEYYTFFVRKERYAELQEDCGDMIQ